MSAPLYIHPPAALKGETLDTLLSYGWYRYGAGVFTIHSFTEGDREYAVHWLRYEVSKIRLSRSARKIVEQIKRWSVTVKEFQLTPELEALHERYYGHITFQTGQTLTEILEDTGTYVFDTRLVEVRDGDRLIAAGIFDCGKNSIAGIKNIYDPAYLKISPGKMLMLLKYRYCLEQGMEWFYPGYIAPGHSRFDYKLFLDPHATEVWHNEATVWLPYPYFSKMNQM